MKVANIVANSFLIVLWLFVGLVGYWLFLDDLEPYVANYKKINATEFYYGDIVHIDYETDFLRACKIEGTRYIVNMKTQEKFQLGKYEYQIRQVQVGRTQPYAVEFVIPSNLPAGEYAFAPSISWKCNLIQKVLPRYREEDYKIIFNVKGKYNEQQKD